MNTEILAHTLHQSEAGNITFPQVIMALAAEGVEGYYADLIRREDTFYFADGHTHVEPMTLPAIPVAEEFSAEELITAIRAAQRDEIRYPVFIERAIQSGTAAYRVCISGKRVLYLGRKGDIHVEHFPQPKA